MPNILSSCLNTKERKFRLVSVYKQIWSDQITINSLNFTNNGAWRDIKRNERTQNQQPDIAGITFCFHNRKTAYCKTHPRPVSNDICILTKNEKRNERKNTIHNHKNHNVKREKRNSYGNEITFGTLFTQSADLSKQCSRSWKDKTIWNMFWKLVKHNNYGDMELYETTHNANRLTTETFHKWITIRKWREKWCLEKRIHQITRFHESWIQCADQRINFTVGYSIAVAGNGNSIPNLWTQKCCTNDPSHFIQWIALLSDFVVDIVQRNKNDDIEHAKLQYKRIELFCLQCEFHEKRFLFPWIL